jgi:hypothetical protein
MTATYSPSYNIQIWTGLKEGYDGVEHSMGRVEEICQAYCNESGLCVSITPTTYVYTGGRETGVVVGIISYPRFPQMTEDLVGIAKEIGVRLLTELGQNRITITTPDTSIMIEK